MAVYVLLSAKRRAYFCQSIAIEMRGASRYFSKVSGSGVDLTLLINGFGKSFECTSNLPLCWFCISGTIFLLCSLSWCPPRDVPIPILCLKLLELTPGFRLVPLQPMKRASLLSDLLTSQVPWPFFWPKDAALFAYRLILVHLQCRHWRCIRISLPFLLIQWSFFYLQLATLAFVLTIGTFLLTAFALLLTVGAFLLTVGKRV